MAGGMDVGTKQRGTRSLDVTINVVPFIDLMAVTISFLLLTAVWTQAGQLPVGTHGAPSTDTSDVQRPLSPPVRVHVTEAGVRVAWAEGPAGELQLLTPAALRARLEGIARYSERRAPVLLQAQDDVAYAQVVAVLDACLGAGLADVTVQTGL